MTLHTGELYCEGAICLAPPDVAVILAAPADSDVRAPRDHWVERARDDEDVYYFALYAADRLVGQILLHDVDSAAGEALVGYHLFRRSDRGKGIGTAALRLLQEFVAQESGLTRLMIITTAGNRASRRIAEKCGFEYMGAPREDPTGVVLMWEANPRDSGGETPHSGAQSLPIALPGTPNS